MWIDASYYFMRLTLLDVELECKVELKATEFFDMCPGHLNF